MHSNFSSWARNVPDFFLPDPAATRILQSSHPTKWQPRSQLPLKPLNGSGNSDARLYDNENGFEALEKGFSSDETGEQIDRSEVS